MSAGARVAGFVAVLAVIFGCAALAGRAVDPDGTADGGAAHGHASGTLDSGATSVHDARVHTAGQAR